MRTSVKCSRAAFRALASSDADLGGEHRAKFHQNRTVLADVYPSFGQEILDVSQRERVSYDQTDHFW
jgi:hypothetical protein